MRYKISGLLLYEKCDYREPSFTRRAIVDIELDAANEDAAIEAAEAATAGRDGFKVIDIIKWQGLIVGVVGEDVLMARAGAPMLPGIEE